MQVTDPLFITIVITVAAALALAYKYFKPKWQVVNDFLAKTQFDEIAEAAVNEVYQEYVRELKANAADGDLTSEDKKEALKKAKDAFIRIAKEKGLSAAIELGKPLIELFLEKAIDRRKAEAAGVVTTPVPPNV